MFWFMVEEITNYVGVALGDECAHTPYRLPTEFFWNALCTPHAARMQLPCDI